MAERGWEMITTRSDVKMIASRTKERKVCGQTRGIDAPVSYCVETSMARDGKRLYEVTVRRM